jgi:hypothetical protein
MRNSIVPLAALCLIAPAAFAQQPAPAAYKPPANARAAEAEQRAAEATTLVIANPGSLRQPPGPLCGATPWFSSPAA